MDDKKAFMALVFALGFLVATFLFAFLVALFHLSRSPLHRSLLVGLVDDGVVEESLPLRELRGFFDFAELEAALE